MMALLSLRVGLARTVVAAALTAVCASPVLAQKKGDQKPDAGMNAQQQAQNQEIETVIHAADAAMAAAPAASDIPVQVTNDYLKALDKRVWVPLTLMIDQSKRQPGPVTLYLRVAPRGMTAPPAPAAPEPANPKDKKKNDKNDKNKDAKAPAPPASSYPYEDVAFMDLKP